MSLGEEYPHDGLDLLPEEPYYDSEEVADAAIWPAVDELWWGDWRAEAHPGLEFQFPKRAELQGETVDVHLIAGRELVIFDEGEGEKPGYISYAHLMLETVTSGSIRDYIISCAYEYWEEIQAASADHHDPEDLLAKSTLGYTFNTAGEFIGSSSQDVALVADGGVVWTSDFTRDSSEDTDQRKLHAADLDRIGDALMVLTESVEYREVIDALKMRPIETA